MENTNSLNRFLNQIQIQLNDQQRAATARIHGATLLLAVPGSGKTTVMICRLGYMIKVLKIPPDQILAMTFSRAGARDLKNRYETLIGSETEAPHFSTIHSFAYRVIRLYSHQTGRSVFKVLEDPAPVLRELYIQCFRSFPGDTELEELISNIGMMKNLMLSRDEIKKSDLSDVDLLKIYDAYEHYKRENRVMDYDDMLVYALGLLRREKALFHFFVNQYRYICLDEAQDTSKLQFAIIELLAKPSGNLFMVGDEDQSIYGFRGAYPQALLDYKITWPEGQVLLMETNYRSTALLVNAADRFISLNPERYTKKMHTPNPAGVPAVWEKVNSREEQYTFIINSITKEGKEMAILYRNNESVIPLVDLLETHHIPYVLKEHNPIFFSHFIMRDLRSFYALAADPTDMETFRSIYFKMNCYITKKMLDAAEKRIRPGETVLNALAGLSSVPEWQKDKLLDAEDAFKQLNRCPMFQGISLILKELGYQDHLDYRISHGYPREKIEQKLAIVKSLASRYRCKDDFWQRLAALEIILKDPSQKPIRENLRSPIVLSTIHSAKGLEWEKVFLIDCIEGEFPSHSALAETKEGKKLMAEETRLFYVAVTRAKRELEFITIGNTKSRSTPTVSRFVRYYMGERPEQKKAKKKNRSKKWKNRKAH